MRILIWVKSARVRGWGCSDCGWTFEGTGPPQGDSISEMIESFERLRDKEFASHVCAKHPKTKNESHGKIGEKP